MRLAWVVAAAFDAARPGEPCQVVDDAARAVLAKAGLGPDYQLPGLPHRTGHGIGLAIHEAPYLVRGERSLVARSYAHASFSDLIGLRWLFFAILALLTTEWVVRRRSGTY